jgi:hypothetical protein
MGICWDSRPTMKTRKWTKTKKTLAKRTKRMTAKKCTILIATMIVCHGYNAAQITELMRCGKIAILGIQEPQVVAPTYKNLVVQTDDGSRPVTQHYTTVRLGAITDCPHSIPMRFHVSAYGGDMSFNYVSRLVPIPAV